VKLDAPLVSVCIPAHNAERWLAEALESALAQTFADFEVVVADNGSTDGTAKVLGSYADPRIRVDRSRERISAVANHNRAVRLARGEFVKFLHVDDLLRPDCLERMVELALEDPSIALVFAPREVLVEPGFEPEWGDRFARPHEHFESLERVNDGRALFRQMLDAGFEENWIGEPSAVLVRRASLERAGLLNERLFQIADLELWARLAFEHRIGFVDRVLSAYRHHEESTTAANARVGRDWLDKLWLFESLLQLPGLTPAERARLHQLRRAALRRASRSQIKRILRGRWSPDLTIYLAARLRQQSPRRTGIPGHEAESAVAPH
jgi:glycosyltransferase involved in cell wall biosynthesis